MPVSESTNAREYVPCCGSGEAIVFVLDYYGEDYTQEVVTCEWCEGTGEEVRNAS